MKEKRNKKASGEAADAAAEKSGRKGLLQQTSPFALSEEERSEAEKAEVAGGGESAGSAEKKPEKKKRLLDRPSPFVLNANDFAQDDSEENLDEQLQFQESEVTVELPMDRELEEESRRNGENTAPPAKKHRRRWYGIPMGTLVLCLALVGLIFIGMQAYRYIYDKVTDDSTERTYDTYLTPVVMLDPEPFESLDAADKEMLLQAAVWKTVFENAASVNEYDDHARMIFSGELVRSNAVKLFGVNCILTPADIYLPGSGAEEGMAEGTISYDEATDTYHVPLIGNVGTYQPYTVSVRNKGDVATLRVAYCVLADNVDSTIPTVSQTADSSPAAAEEEIIQTENETRLRVIKYLEYEISYDEDTQLQYISAIRSPEEG